MAFVFFQSRLEFPAASEIVFLKTADLVRLDGGPYSEMARNLAASALKSVAKNEIKQTYIQIQIPIRAYVRT